MMRENTSPNFRPRALTLKPSPTPVTQTYAYDDAGEVSQVSYTHGASTDDLSYGYDAAGRRSGVWGSYGRVSLPTATTSNAVYDLANRLTSWNGTTAVNDNNGNLTSDGTFTYTYNARNQLTAVDQGQTNQGNFAYDGLGRRIVRTVGGATTKPAYDGWNLVQERAMDGSVSANYVAGLGLDEPLVRTAGSSTNYYLSDALGSIVGLADSTGAVPTTYSYEPYGKTTASGTASSSFFGFTGRENDSTGTLSLYNYRARTFSPALGRFLQEDPTGFLGRDFNLYRYVGGRPTYQSDPLGLSQPDCGVLGCFGLNSYEITVLSLDILAGVLSFTAAWAFLTGNPLLGGALFTASFVVGWASYGLGTWWTAWGDIPGGVDIGVSGFGAANNLVASLPYPFGVIAGPMGDISQLALDFIVFTHN